tara:strand:+ start:639 stop:869 length:231 start_codon:yes stop_codon:yes gene_type:complete
MTIASINVHTPSGGASSSLNRTWATKSEVAILQEQVDNLEEEIRRLKQENDELILTMKLLRSLKKDEWGRNTTQYE